MPEVITPNIPAPALNTTSDMPQVESAIPPVSTEAPPAAPTEVVVAEPTTPPEPPVQEAPSPIRERFSELAAQRRQAEERAARLESLASAQSEQIKSLLEKLNTTSPIVPDAIVSENLRPMRESFSSPEEFESALVSWASTEAADKAVSAMRLQQEQSEKDRAERERVSREETQAREVATKLQTDWDTRRLEANKKYSDFDTVTQNPDLQIPSGSPMAYAILTRDDGAEIAYYLGKHPEEAAEIAGMTVPGQFFPIGTPNAGQPVWDAVAQSFALGKIAAKLETAPIPVPEVPEVPVPDALSNALAPALNPSPSAAPVVILPTPPAPISGSSAAATRRADAELSTEEYAARHEARIKKSLGLRGSPLQH